MPNFQQKLIEDKSNNFKIPDFRQLETACGRVEEVDCSNLNILIPDHPNSLLSLSLNRSSQQQVKKYDETLAQHIREVKEQMKDQYFVMSSKPCNLSKNQKAYLSIDKSGVLQKIRYSYVNCNSWTCPKCAPKKAVAISRQMAEIVMINNLIYYLTLTLNPSKLAPEDIFSSTHKIISGLFNHFLTIIRRKTFKYFNEKKKRYFVFNLKNSELKLKYVWVIEFQKNGMAHMHILLNQFLPVEVIRKVWVHVGGGHVMKIERARSLQAVAKYITKYITKDLDDSKKRELNFKYFERRYSISQSCERPQAYSLKMSDSKTSNYDIMLKLREMGLSFVYDKLNDSPTNL